MTPEAANQIAMSRENIAEARQIFAIGLVKPAARSAYYAAFHSAQALIHKQTGRIAKTHRGVNVEFHRLVQQEGLLDAAAADFLSKMYGYKQIGDYGGDSSMDWSIGEIATAIERSAQLVEAIAKLLDE